MAVGIAGLHDLKKPVPVRFSFFLHEIVFVGQGPPNISESSQTAQGVTKIAVVLNRHHPVKAPMALVVRMKQDNVRFDSQVAQVRNSLFEVLKELWIEPGEIPGSRRGSLKRVKRRFVAVPVIMLGK